MRVLLLGGPGHGQDMDVAPGTTRIHFSDPSLHPCRMSDADIKAMEGAKVHVYHRRELLEGAVRVFIHGDCDVQELLSGLLNIKAVERYNFLRDQDRFPMDQGPGPSHWEVLCELHGEGFDSYVDHLMELPE